MEELKNIHPEDVRRCSHCGKPMKEGYYIDGEYACDNTCAIALYNGDAEQFRADLELDEECNYGCVYYTEWVSYDMNE